MEIIWKKTLDSLKQSLTPQQFETWIKPIQFIKLDNNKADLEVPNRFVLDWIKKNYLNLLQEFVSNAAGGSCKINLSIANKIVKKHTVSDAPTPPATPPVQQKKETEKIPQRGNVYNLNSRYTFETFVLGSSNQFASAAAAAVANNPATTYNPLFIYGGVGLGKTHLVNAVGNAILKKNPEMKVCYYTSEKFMNELINSLRYAKMDEFRNKFRSMDVLLIDDVQFIAGKERTQEEFFHTFNALYDSHKQIVVTSDKFPKEIPGLEERLRSRFEWGLIADIQAPDLETKQAILK